VYLRARDGDPDRHCGFRVSSTALRGSTAETPVLPDRFCHQVCGQINAMNGSAKTFRVFLSHTSEMAAHPQGRSFVAAALDAVREAGMVAVDMRDFPAASKSPTELDSEQLLPCDIYVGILGFKFGMPARDQPDLSYTQQEFRTAKAAGRTLLVFLLDETADGLPGTVFLDRQYGAQQEAFRQEVLNLDGKGLVCQFFKTADELHRLVLRALHYCSRDPGGNPPPGPRTADQFEAILARYCERQTAIWQACLSGEYDRHDRLDLYVEPHYSLLKPEAQIVDATNRFGRGKRDSDANPIDGHSAYEPVAAETDDAETELAKLLTTSPRLCLAEDAGAGKSVFTRRALAFACTQAGQRGLFGGKPGLVVRWEQWEKDWPTDFHRALADAIADDCGTNPAAVSPDDVVTWALQQGRVLLILDGLDQVNNDTVIRGVSMFLSGAGRKCRAIVTGRPYKVDHNRRTLFRGDEWRFARIEGFNGDQIAEYLQGYDVDKLFPQRQSVNDLIKIPSVLRIVRELVEQGGFKSFDTRGELYLQASYHLILRAGKLVASDFDDRQTRRVEQILAAVAFEMMTRRMYGYSARGVDTVDQVERGAARRCENGISPQEWTMIRGVTNFTNHCILEGSTEAMLSWQHRGMMEFYGGLHLARYATGSCLEDAKPFANDPDWHWVWRFAIEMPKSVVDTKTRTAALAALFHRPATGRRPNELIQRAWMVMESTGEGQVELTRFQNDFRDLLDQGHPLAAQLEASFRPCPPDPSPDKLTFTMGSPKTEEGRSSDEEQVEMTVAPFAMSNAPVTKAQYWLYDPAHQHDPAIANDVREYSPQDDCPVIAVTWYDAWCFARWCGSRLPTEVEWEYACRAGTTTPYWWGKKMNKSKCTFETNHTTPASASHANRWGLMEMSGNVYEWCDTWYDPQIETSSRPEFVGISRVLRGGSFNLKPRILRSAYRLDFTPDFRSLNFGFRVSRTPYPSGV
jgi:hypothetical protein